MAVQPDRPTLNNLLHPNKEYKAQFKRAFDLSNFDLNAILRGMELTLVGAHRALQNPALFTSAHYRQAAAAVAAGLAIRLGISIPILGVRAFLWFLSLIFNLDSVTWDDRIVDGLNFMANHVLQVPLFVMTLMRYITPTLDNLWVDTTYVHKHKHDNPNQLRDMYYQNLRQYSPRDGSTHTASTAEAVSMFFRRSWRKAAISLFVFAFSYVPVIGRLVLPAASFYTFNQAVGLGPASVIFGTGLFLPRRYLVIFLQAYYSSRRLMRELLEPYFARVPFTSDQKRNWFRSREGLLFGFGIGFYVLLRVPLLGVLICGIAEASTAYLITKVTDPLPPASNSEGFAASQQQWRNKLTFLSLSLGNLDKIHDKPPAYSAVDLRPAMQVRNSADAHQLATGKPKLS